MKKNLLIIRRLWDLLKPFHKHFYIQLGFTIVDQLFSISATFILSKVLDTLIHKDVNFLIYLLVSYFIVSLVQNKLYGMGKIRSLKHLDQSISQHIQEYSFKRIFRLNISQYIEDHSAIKLLVITRGENSAEEIISRFVLDLLPVVTQTVFSVVALSIYSLPVGILTVITIFTIAWWTNRFANWHRPMLKDNTTNWDMQNKSRAEAFQHLPLVKTLSAEKYFLDKYLNQRKNVIDFYVNTWVPAFIHGNRRGYATKFAGVASISILSFGFLSGSLTIGGLYAAWTWMNDSFSNIQNIVKLLRWLPLRFVEVEKYFEAVDKEPLFNENGKQKFVAGDINFENVTFKYPKSEGDVLKGVSFTIKQNTKVAIVGRSGSGKTTITKLLLRMYDWDGGDIVVGGKSLRTLNSHSLRSHVGYVEQHIDLFDSTLRDNILLGVHDRKVSEKELEQIAKSARITEFYHRLGEAKFDTVLGERGIKLSGGERQRVGIARALIKNPDILIFDEATSALDSENEKYIKEAIDEASEGRTTIIIAHRLSTIFDADKIIVMDRGQIVGEGSHAELMQTCATYRELVEHQELV